MKVKVIVKIAVVAALYAALTILLTPISYGQVQFRIAEFMVLLPFIDRKYIWGLTLGCVIANIYSPLGLPDVIFGSAATLISGYLVSISKNLKIATLYPAVINGIIVGLELHFILHLPLFATMLYVFLGELAVVVLLSYTLTSYIIKNKKLLGYFKF